MIAGGLISLLVACFFGAICYALMKLQARFVGISTDSITMFTYLEKSQAHLAVRILSNIMEALSLVEKEEIKQIESSFGPQPEEVGIQAAGSAFLDILIRFAASMIPPSS